MLIAASITVDGIHFTGARHADILAYLRHLGIKSEYASQGFITDKAEHLNRRKAYDHAVECGQLEIKGMIGGVLTSEDLW